MIKTTVYLAGKITGDPCFFSKFYEAQRALEEAGYIVLSGIRLPQEGFTWEQYMRITAAMLEECETVCFLPNWKDSRGAAYEYGQAAAREKFMFFYADWLEERRRACQVAPQPVMCEEQAVRSITEAAQKIAQKVLIKLLEKYDVRVLKDDGAARAPADIGREVLKAAGVLEDESEGQSDAGEEN